MFQLYNAQIYIFYTWIQEIEEFFLKYYLHSTQNKFRGKSFYT